MPRTKSDQKRIARQARAGQPKPKRWPGGRQVPSMSQRRAYNDAPGGISPNIGTALKQFADPRFQPTKAATHFRPADSRAKSGIVQAGRDLSRMPANAFRGGKYR